MSYRSVPKREEIISELGLFGCPGEYVPVTFSLYPLEPLSDVRLRAGDFTGPEGAVIPSSAIDIRRVEHHPLWQEKWIAYSFKAQENLLRRFDRLDLPVRRNQRFWLTAKLADGQKPGVYTGTGASMWCYNHGRFRGRFWSYIDLKKISFSPTEHKLMFSYVRIEDDEIIPTVKWEAIREGVDDYRYLRTLEQFAAGAASADDGALRAAGEAGLRLLDEIRESAAPVVTKAAVADHDKPSLLGVDNERRRVAEAILAILKANGLVEGEWTL